MNMLIFGIVLIIVGIVIIYTTKDDDSFLKYLACLGAGTCMLAGLLFAFVGITMLI